MVIALCIGRSGSKGFPGKNKYIINGHPMMSYPIRAAKSCKLIDEVFFSTDSQELANIANYYGAKVIDRPAELATDEALAEDVFVHGASWIKERLLEFEVELWVLLFANAPCLHSMMLQEMIEWILWVKTVDSVATFSKYDMWSPYRARVFNSCQGLMLNFLPQEQIKGNCNRDSAGDTWFYDCSAAVVRPKCLENIEQGYLPQRWLGRNTLAYKQKDPALDVDYAYQRFQVEDWLKRNWK